MTSERFRQELKAEIKLNRSLGRKGANWENAAVARCTLNEDLGHYPDSAVFDYALNEATRDRLIANGRQDAAHALCNTTALLRQVQSMKRWLILAASLLVFQTFLLLGR